jgi:predicted Zn-dependent protease
MSMPSDPRRFAGALSDGHSAATTRVEVALAEAGVELRLRGERQALVWPYDKLHSAVPLSAAAPDVLLGLKDGASALFVADPVFARPLLARAPALSTVRQRWHGLRPGISVLAGVLVVAAAMWFYELHPAQAMARLMPQPTREALGRAVIAGIVEQHKVCETQASRVALDRLTQRLTAAAANTPLAVRVLLLDWSLVNAFAAPGGQIVLTRGLIRQAVSPDEVAGVLAHELGHALELHPETGVVRAMGLAAATQLIFAGSAGTLSNVGIILTQLRYTRIAEREADAHALRILKGAGISAKGFGDFFERLEGKGPPSETAKRISEYELIRTHPRTRERIGVVRAQPDYPATAALAAEDWQALRNACGLTPVRPAPSPGLPSAEGSPLPSPGSTQQETDAERDIAEATRTLAANPNDVAALQKRARAHAVKREHALALADYKKALESKPQDASLHLGRGLAHQGLQQYEDALEAFDATLRLAPNHAGARNSRGIANRALKRYDVALADFDQLIRTNPKYIAAYYNHALVNIDLKRPEDAIRDLGSAIELDKDYAGAYTQRGLLREKAGARDPAIADFRAALAAPAKYESGAWAHRTARERLKALGIDVP